MFKKPPLRIQPTTLWDYPSQHYGNSLQGDPNYIGATPSYIIWNLLKRYTRAGNVVVDPCCGSGTTLDVCKDLDLKGVGFDINPQRDDITQADARKIPLDSATADFVFIDPPYSTHVDYSDDPRCIGKLSAASGEYYKAMRVVINEIYRVLKPDRYFALYVSDSYVKGKGFYPIGFDLFKLMQEKFTPVDIVSVVRHNKTLKMGNYRKAAEEGNFFLRGFNYLFIMHKPAAPKRDWRKSKKSKPGKRYESRDSNDRRSNYRNQESNDRRSNYRKQESNDRRSNYRNQDSNDRRSNYRNQDSNDRRSNYRNQDSNDRRSNYRNQDSSDRRSNYRNQDSNDRRSNYRNQDSNDRRSNYRNQDSSDRRSNYRNQDSNDRRSNYRNQDSNDRRSNYRNQDSSDRRSNYRNQDSNDRRSNYRNQDSNESGPRKKSDRRPSKPGRKWTKKPAGESQKSDENATSWSAPGKDRPSYRSRNSKFKNRRPKPRNKFPKE